MDGVGWRKDKAGGESAAAGWGDGHALIQQQADGGINLDWTTLPCGPGIYAPLCLSL